MLIVRSEFSNTYLLCLFHIKAMEEDYDDAKIEEEIELELSKISFSSSDIDDPDTDVSLEDSSDSEAISDELPESVLHYLNFVRSRSQNAESLILQDLESEEMSSDIYRVIPENASECLAELASEYNEDPEELKKRILSQIDDEEQQMNETLGNAIEPNNSGDFPSNEVADGCSLTDDGDTIISFTYQEVEEKCKQEYEIWVEKQKELEGEKIKQLKAKRVMEETENEEEEKRRQQRQKELEAERMKLEMFHEQQQIMMEEELLKEEEAWKEQLKQHKEFINNLHIQIEEEKRVFEEQRAMERQILAEQQNMAAVKIQSAFRAFMVYKKHAPVLKEWRAELKRKKELQEAMEKEMEEKQERWKRRALEKKEQEEKERKRREEKESKELAEKMKRHEIYERKKEIMRLQREQLMLEELKREEKCKQKFMAEKEIKSESIDKEVQLFKNQHEAENAEKESITEKGEKEVEYIDKVVEIKKIQKIEVMKEKTPPKQMEEVLQNTDNALEKANIEEEIKNEKEQEEYKGEKEELMMGKEHNKEEQKVSSVEEKENEKYGTVHEKLQHADERSEEGKLKSRKKYFEINSEKLLENDVKDHCSTAFELQKNSKANAPSFETITVINQESSIHNSSMDIHLDSGDTEQVTTVTFQDLPGCSLCTLSQCSKLQFLSLRRCGLLSLEGLSNCKDLKYIDVEENNIQVIN
ncbi:hypothetical protein JD844_028070 [Phrynosoma platyrhinos]|uniref:Leucine-rich repeat and IQ domain-containing protein 1 n=1 Tax=Phrynosoma platyrhinos TaxID=52577 RepID=A0ABQ7SHA0_PHRPL|nr:hypothetical protein JD844_028070 [Phrynosoma platyrhinos]